VPPPVPRYNEDRVILKWTTKDASFSQLSDLLVVTACCRCYQLGYQISAAAPYTALKPQPIQCNVEVARVYNAHAMAHLPPSTSTVSFASCWAATSSYFITLTLLMVWVYQRGLHRLISWALLLHTCTCKSCLLLSSFGPSRKNRDPWPQPHSNRIRIILKRTVTRVQCIYAANQLTYLHVGWYGLKSLLYNSTAVHVQRQRKDVAAYSLCQRLFLLSRAKLKELLNHVVSKHIHHQTVRGRQDLTEYQSFLSQRRMLQLLLNKPANVYIQSISNVISILCQSVCLVLTKPLRIPSNIFGACPKPA